MRHASTNQVLQWADSCSDAIHFDMQVNHRRADVFVAEKLLDRSQIDSSLQQMRGKTMSQRMRSHALQDLCAVCCLFDLASNVRFVHVMATDAASLRARTQ